MTFGPTFRFRRGDAVRFARGSNEYVGMVEHVSPTLTYLLVTCEALGETRIGYRHVLELVHPMLTEKERAALEVLDQYGKLTVFEAKEAAGLPLTGTVLRNLRERGLVRDVHEGVTSSRAPSWELTEEGERVCNA